MAASSSLQVRLIDPSEVMAWGESVSLPFLSPIATDADRSRLERWAPMVEVERSWAVVDNGRFVGNSGTLTRTITLPAGPDGVCPAVPFAAVTAVGVHPTHRRRGLLRRLMGAMLADARQRGEVLAGLQASQSIIYGRFGYGWAVSSAQHAIDPRHSAFAVPAPDMDIDLLIGEDAAKVVPAVFERARRRSPGQTERPEAVWNAEIFSDPADDRGKASARAWAVCDGGVAGYRAEQIWDRDDLGGGRLLVRDLVGETPEIEAALWRFLFDIDLVSEVVATHRPPEDPIRHRLADPRRLRTQSVHDFMWLRILDVPGALTARGYLTEGRLVFDVTAPQATPGADGADVPDPAVGRWVLEAGPDGSSCRAAGAGDRTDLTLGVAELSSLLVGEVKATTLAAAGRIREERPGRSAAADVLFASGRVPCSLTGF